MPSLRGPDATISQSARIHPWPTFLIAPPPAPTTLAEEASSGALRLWKTLRKHWGIIASTLILSVGVAVTYNRTAEVAYQATALVEFDPNPIRPLGEKGASLSPNYSSYWDHREFFETQYKLLVSDEVMRRVIQSLGLMSDPEFLPKKTSQNGVPSRRTTLRRCFASASRSSPSRTAASFT